MAPSKVETQKSGSVKEKNDIDLGPLENLLLRDEEIFQTSLNSEDYLESLAPIITDALKANGLTNLILRLNDIVKDKDEELNELSLNSTGDINSCIDAIDRIHEDSYDFNRGLSQINQSLNKSVYELITRKKNLVKRKEVSSKINETSVVLNLCIQVLENTNKIHELIKQHKYFSALKLIEELTNIHLPKVNTFSFAVKIYDSIPHLTRMIKDESFEGLCKWLSVNMERRLMNVGERLFENIMELHESWNKMKMKQRSFLPFKVNSPVEISLRDPALNYNALKDSILQIDLSTLYDAILVYETLGQSELLSKSYTKEWTKKYNRIIYPITSATAHSVAEFSDLSTLSDYLKKIVAFFIMDKQINIATKFKLRTEANSNDLWNSYITKLKPVLLNFLKKSHFDIEELNSFKDLIGDFLQILENKGYRIFELYDVLMILFKDHFAPILIREFRLDFIDSIQSDHYMPLVVTEQSDYENILKVCWYQDDAPFTPKNVRSLPTSFPFSEDYVHYCLGIRSLLEDALEFISTHYNYEINEVNSIIVNDIFEKVLSDEKGVGISYDIKDFIGKNSNNKEITAQSFTNLEYYLYSLYEVGAMMNRRLKLNTGVGIYKNDGVFTLGAVSHFTNVRKFSEATIFDMVDAKIRELLDMVEYNDWLPKIANSEPNYSIKDFALFLENLFTSIFSNLPKSIRTLGLFRSYDFVAEHFLSILKNADVYNKVAIQNFDLDIRHLEDSMTKLHETETDQGNGKNVALETTFTELRQCVNLLLLDNYDDFKSSSFRMRHFDRVKYEDGIKLLSKVVKEDEDEENSSYNEESFNTSAYSTESQAGLSNSAAAKFAKFSSRFKKNTLE